MSANDVRRALEIGCPVWAARLLLDLGDPGIAYYRKLVKRGELTIQLPANCPELTESTLSGLDVREQLSSGVYCLATYYCGTELVGAVQRLEVGRGSSAAWTGFDVGCSRGEEAALTWIYSKAGLCELRMERSYQSLSLVGARVVANQGEKVGESAGLAAAIATVWDVVGACNNIKSIAATGRVDGCGNVLSVGHVREKIAAVLRETPEITHVVVPADDEDQVGLLPAGVQLVAARTVEQVLDLLFPEIDSNQLAVMAPDTAAERAVELEFSRQHGPAYALAKTLLDTRPQWSIDGHDAVLAEIQVRMIFAVNLTHVGEKAAIEEFETIDSLVHTLGENHLNIDLRCAIAAIRVSTLIDLLEFEQGLQVCEELASSYKHANLRPKMIFLGSWSRVLGAAGKHEQAVAKASEQLKTPLRRGDKAHEFQARCNLIGGLLSGVVPEQDLRLVRDELDKAEVVNAGLPESCARERNEIFLRLWRACYYAETGQPESAAALVKSETFGRFPEHHLHRFVAEALLADGREDQALARLVLSRRGNQEPAGSFAHLVLLSAAAVEAIVRIDLQYEGWLEPAESFLQAMAAWAPRHDYRPDSTASSEFRKALTHALSILPY